jgi:hypothetical protein
MCKSHLQTGFWHIACALYFNFVMFDEVVIIYFGNNANMKVEKKLSTLSSFMS